MIELLYEAQDSDWSEPSLENLIARAGELGDQDVLLAAAQKLAMTCSDAAKSRYIFQYCIKNLVADQHPEWALNCHFNLALLELREGNYDAALSEFETAYSNYPKKPGSGYAFSKGEAAFGKGIALVQKERWSEARVAFVEAHGSFGSYLPAGQVAAAYNAAVCAARLGEYATATELLRGLENRDAEEIFPTFPVRVLVLRARLYFMQNDLQSARVCLEKALSQLALSIPDKYAPIHPDLLQSTVDEMNDRPIVIIGPTPKIIAGLDWQPSAVPPGDWCWSSWQSRMIDPLGESFAADIAGDVPNYRIDPSATGIAANEPIPPSGFPTLSWYPDLPVKDFAWADITIPGRKQQTGRLDTGKRTTIATVGTSDFIDPDKHLIAQDTFSVPVEGDTFDGAGNSPGVGVTTGSAAAVVPKFTREQFLAQLYGSTVPPVVVTLVDRFNEPEFLMRLLALVQTKQGDHENAARTNTYTDWRMNKFISGQFLPVDKTFQSTQAMLLADIDPSQKGTARTRLYGLPKPASHARDTADDTSARSQAKTASRTEKGVALRKRHSADRTDAGDLAGFACDIQAVSLGLEGKWQEAILKHREAVTLDPESVPFRINLSAAYMEYGKQLKSANQLAAASNRLRMALLVDPSNDEALFYLKETLKSLGSDPDDQQLSLVVAQDAFAAGDYVTAVTELQRHNPPTQNSLCQLAYMYMRMGATLEAYRLLEKAAKEESPSGQEQEMARCHAAIGDINRQYATAARASKNDRLAITRLFNSAVAYRRAATYRPSVNAAQNLEQALRAVCEITPSGRNLSSLDAAVQMKKDNRFK